MKSKYILVFLGLLITTSVNALPSGFVYLKDINPTIIQDMRYPTSNNFIGRPIAGYEKATCILTQQAASALSALQKELLAQHLSLKVYDCYRPQMAVNDFIVWSKVVNDQKMKQSYYPNVNKADFFKLGYVAAKSSHTRGSTADLTIVQLHNGNQPPTELPMGTHFDFMDERSHALSPNIQGEARKYRLFLRNMMVAAGFVPYDDEWWHFTLKNEPYPDTYFNFPVA